MTASSATHGTTLVRLLNKRKQITKDDATRILDQLEANPDWDARELLSSVRALSLEQMIAAQLKLGWPDDWSIPGYRVESKVGSGAMGAVYRAIRLEDEQEVALKLISDRYLSKPKAVDRFRRELDLARQLDFIGLPWYGEEGKTRFGGHFYTMQFVRGEDLKQRMLRTGGPISEELAWKVLYQMALTLQHLESKAIVHRDIKPANILIDDEVIWLCDLGLARSVDDEAEMTGEDLVMGTPLYMSPEQAKGKRDLTTACDVYGLGATLYMCVAGRPPFDGTAAIEVMRAHVERTPEPVREHRPEISKELDQTILQMLGKRPDQRPTPSDLERHVDRTLKSLHDPMAGVPASPRPTTKSTKTRPAPNFDIETIKAPSRTSSQRRSGSNTRRRLSASASGSATRRTRTGTVTVARSGATAGSQVGRSGEVGRATTGAVPLRRNPLPMQLGGAALLAVAVLVVILATRGGGSGPPVASSSTSAPSSTPASAISDGSSVSSGEASSPTSSASSSSDAPPIPTVAWIEYQAVKPIAGGVELDLAPLKTHGSWMGLNGALETGEVGSLPGVTPRAVPLGGPLAANPRLAALKNGMGQLPLLQLDAGAGFQLPVVVHHLKTLQLEFLRDTGGAISDWCSLRVAIGALVIEVGRVDGEQRYHRLAEQVDGKLKDLARTKLTIDYLDHDATLHELAVIVRGRKVEVVIIAGQASWKLATERDAVTGPLGVAVAGARGSIKLPRLTLAAGKLIGIR